MNSDRRRPFASRVLRLLRLLLLAAVIGFASRFLIRQWGDVAAVIGEMPPLSVALSFLMILAGLGAAAMSWVSVLNGLGPSVSISRGSQIMLVGSLGKYVPGSAWAYLLQMELGRLAGIARPRVLITTLYATGIGVVASLGLSALALPTVLRSYGEFRWLYLVLPIGICSLHPRVMTWFADLVLKVFRRPSLVHRVQASTVFVSVGWVLLSYVLYGAHLWLLANALIDPTFGTLVLLTGAISLAFTVGLAAFLLPSGLGAREVALIIVLMVILTKAEASAITLVSRAMFTAGELLAAGVAAAIAVSLRRHKFAGGDATGERSGNG